MTGERIVLIGVFLICGLIMAGIGNRVMEMQHPVRQDSRLLENYLIMQPSAGNNSTSPNLTYVIGNYGYVVSFNNILSETEMRYYQKGGVSINLSPPRALP